MTITHSRDGDWIRACIARTPGAWGEFVRRTLPLSLSLVERIFDRHGVLCNQPDRDRILENLYAGFLAEDRKVLRSFQAGYDLSLWLGVYARKECRQYISDSRRQSPLGLVRSVREPDPNRMVEVLHEIPSSVRGKVAAHFEGPPCRVPDSLREILSECRGKLIDLIVSGKEMSACLPFGRLSAFADGVTTEKISLHINGCSDCSQELERIAAVNRLLRDLLVSRPRGLSLKNVGDLVERIRPLGQEKSSSSRKPFRGRMGGPK